MKETVIKIENLRKQYRLGTIGGGTLQGDLQSWWAKVRGKEDPNSKIGAKVYKHNETFWALDGLDLEVYKGDTLGIIGGNGAGKSTMLKVLSRVTAPTEGSVSVKGRISSMLEVGTGFHGELTGRENIYLNGAILGMSRAEVDSKIEEIIDFSEVRQFIDTPVKRYSSGMYVKLAFAVAAHLDSEILVMDEVLAVGDMKFQQKCLGKMGDVADKDGRTVLYVSHNMRTIRQLCNRCIVLDHGKIIYNGDVDEAIKIYLGANVVKKAENRIADADDIESFKDRKCKVLSTTILDTEDCIFKTDSKLKFELELYAKEPVKNMHARIILQTNEETPIGTAFTEEFSCDAGISKHVFEFDMEGIAPGAFTSTLTIFLTNNLGAEERLDVIQKACTFDIEPESGYCNNLDWRQRAWGYSMLSGIKKIK